MISQKLITKTVYTIRFFWQITKESFHKSVEDKVPKLGAALSFYMIFSLAPLLTIAIAIAGSIFGEQAAQGQIVSQIEQLIGKEGAITVQTALINVKNADASIWVTIFSIATLLFGATTVFAELHESMNIIWKIPITSDGLFFFLVKERFISFAMVVVMGFLLIVSLIVNMILSFISDFVGNYFTIPPNTLNWLNFGILFIVVFVLFLLVLKFMPDIKVEWKHAMRGSLLTTLLFILGKFLIGLYLGHSSYSSMYGAAGSFAIVLIWIYFSAQIVFLGAEFTYVYSIHSKSLKK